MKLMILDLKKTKINFFLSVQTKLKHLSDVSAVLVSGFRSVAIMTIEVKHRPEPDVTANDGLLNASRGQVHAWGAPSCQNRRKSRSCERYFGISVQIGKGK